MNEKLNSITQKLFPVQATESGNPESYHTSDTPPSTMSRSLLKLMYESIIPWYNYLIIYCTLRGEDNLQVPFLVVKSKATRQRWGPYHDNLTLHLSHLDTSFSHFNVLIGRNLLSSAKFCTVSFVHTMIAQLLACSHALVIVHVPMYCFA